MMDGGDVAVVVAVMLLLMLTMMEDALAERWPG